MKSDVSKTNPGTEGMLARLHEIHLTYPQLLEARAHVMRAEAIADLIVRGTRAIKAGVRWIVARIEKRVLSTRIG